MLLGSVADDFTGASDLANTLARGGMRTTLFVGIPDSVRPECEAGVIALKSRSIPAAEAVAQSLAALEALRAAGAGQILFKYCSTFDSTHEGNIGPVADAMIEALSAPVTIVCPAFPTNLRTIYRGHLFVGDRLLNESGMEKHPLTPMTDANLQRWLSYQSQNRIGLITLDTIRKGPDAIRAALDEAARRKEKLVVCDAITDDDLIRLGEAAKGMALVTGGSGIALGLPANFGRSPAAAAPAPRAPLGKAIALSGSCSRATLAQVARHRAEASALALDAAAIVESRFAPADVLVWLGSEGGAAALPLVYSSAAPEEVYALQARFGTEKVAHAIESFFAGLARMLVASGYRRLITAGGETSSAIVSGLALKALAIGPEIDPGVPALVHEGEPTLALALKSGNFGAPDFFAKALAVMDGMAGGPG